MRTHRLEVRVSKTEKERIEREATVLGISTGDYVRKAAMLLDAEDIVGMEDVRSLLPELNAALTRIHDNIVATAEQREKAQQEIERIRTPEYREEVGRSIAEDEAGLRAIVSLLGLARAEPAASPPEAKVAESHAPWEDDDSPEGGEA